MEGYLMIGFGEDNKEFGKLPPYLIACQEVIPDEESSPSNSLLVRLITETGINLQIKINDYIMHLTRNESYTVWDNYEIRKGNYLIIFEKSRLIDFYDLAIAHTDDYSYPGRGQHFGIYTCNHIIDIISNSTPIIERR
jgi:hypothetical protein